MNLTRLIKRIFLKCMNDPRRVEYYLKNMPELFCRFCVPKWIVDRNRKFDLGESVDSPLSLHVILRTTDAVMNMNSSRNLEEIGIVTKRDVIRMGGRSLFGAAKRFVEKFGRDRLRITLVLDNMSEEGLSLYRESAAEAGVEFDVVQSKGHGNGPSFQTQIDVALADDDETVELIFEDDYLMSEDSLVYPFAVMRDHSRVSGFNPHFHPDRIRFQDYGKLVMIRKRLCCRVSSTCCTFFIRRSALRRQEPYLRFYEGCEIGTVNAVWKREICLAPLGWTLAEHLHRSDLSPVQMLV